MNSDDDMPSEVDSGNETSDDDVDFEMDIDKHTKEKTSDIEDYPYEVLSTEEIVQHMVDSIQEVNAVVQVMFEISFKK